MRAGQRDLDIVVYGATGFVGRLTAEYLAKAGAGVRVALAGRSAERLLAVRQALGAGAENWPLIVADLAQPAALTAMAARTQAVVSAVGPYSRRGLPVVAASAAAPTGVPSPNWGLSRICRCAGAKTLRPSSKDCGCADI